MSIQKKLKEILSDLKEGVTLVAVSKTKPSAAILEAYNSGQRIFGENKVQELVNKEAELPKDIQWHMIGHLQSNKVKFIAPFVSLIHAVDSLKLLKEINKQAEKNNRKIDCLIQIHIAKEENKFGFDLDEARELFSGDLLKTLAGVHVRGLMGMATFSDDSSLIRSEFAMLKFFYEEIKSKPPSKDFNILSMGMSGDYKIAMEEGSNMLRIGSTIFGSRN